MLKHGEWCWLDDGKGNRVRLIADAEQPKGEVTCAHGTHAIQDATTCPDCLGKITHPQWLADRDTLVGLAARVTKATKALDRVKALLAHEETMAPFIQPEAKTMHAWFREQITEALRGA